MLLALLPLIFGLSACGFVGFPGVYRIDVEQGNLVDQEMVDQLQPGMSRRQVRFIMGSPLVEDTFNQNRWDYPYVIRNGQTIIRTAQVSIFFEGDRLVNMTGDYLPSWATPEAENDAAEETGEATGGKPEETPEESV
jgi:outer membrane protein assembly factor BamE